MPKHNWKDLIGGGQGGSGGGNSSNEDDGDDHSPPGQASTSKRLTTTSFMLLDLISKNQSSSTATAYALEVVSMLQLLNFALGSERFHWHSAVRDYVVPGLRVVNFEAIRDLDGGVMPVAFCVSIGMVVGTFALCVWIGSMFWTHGTVRHLWALPLFQFLMKLLTTVLYIPVLTIMGAALSCQGTELDEWVTCGSPARMALTTSVVVVFLAFVAFACVLALVFVDTNPRSHNAAGQVHGRVNCAYILMRALLSLLFGFLGRPSHGEGSPSVLVAAVVTSGVAITSLYAMYLPFHRADMNRLLVVTNGTYMWAGICLVAAEAIADRDDHGALLAFALGAVPVAAALLNVVDRREARLASRELHPGISAFEAELHLRFRLKATPATWAGATCNAYTDVLDVKFPKSAFLTVHLASLAKYLGGNDVMAGQLMRRAQDLSEVRMDQRFLIFRYFQRRRERANGAEGGAMSYVALTHHRKKAEDEIAQLLKLISSLWRLLGASGAGGSGGFKSEELFTVASTIYRRTAVARQHLDQLVTLSNGSKRALLLYALFAEEVLNDTVLAMRLTRAAEASDASEAEDLMSVAAVTISGHPDTLGHIVDATEGVPGFFGDTRSAIMGTNISSLCPPPFDALHDKFLGNYLATNTTFVDIDREIWARNVRGGYAMSVQLTVSAQQDESGQIRFTGRFRKTNKPDFVAVTRDGRLQFFSKQMMKDFGLRHSAGSADSIFSFLPALADVLDLDTVTPAGVTVEVAIDEDVFEVRARLLPFRLEELASKGLILIEFENVGSTNSDSDASADAADDEDDTCVDTTADADGGEDRIVAFRAGTGRGSGRVPGKVSKPVLARAVQRTDLSVAKFDPNVAENDDDDDDDDRRSRRSGRSRGDGASQSSDGSSSTKRSRTHVMKVTVEARVAREQARLLRFRKLCVRLGLIFVVLAVGAYMGSRFYFNSFVSTIKLVHLSGKRAFEVTELALTMEQHLLTTSHGHVDEHFERLLAEQILEAAEELRELHGEIVSAAETQDARQQVALYDASLVAQTLDGVEFSTLNLDAAMLKMATAGVAYLEENITGCERSCQWVLNNGAFDVLDAAMESTEIYVDIARGALQHHLDFDLVVFGVASALALVVVLMRLLPVLAEVRHTKGALLSALDHVPLSQLSDLRRSSRSKEARARHRMKAINSPQDAADSDSDEEHDQHNPEPVTASSPRSSGHATLPPMTALRPPSLSTTVPKRSTKAGAKVAPAAFASASASQARLAAGRRRQRSCAGLCGRLGAIARLCLPLTVVPAYFGFVILEAAVARDRMTQYTNTLDQTALLRVTSQRLHFNLEVPHPPPSWSRWAADPTRFNVTAEQHRLLRHASEQLRAVQFGSDELNTVVLTNKEDYPEQFELQFIDACDGFSECALLAEHDEGDILVHDLSFGLSNALENYIQRAKDFVEGGTDDVQTVEDVASFEAVIALAVATEASMNLYEEALQVLVHDFEHLLLMSCIAFCVTCLTALAIMFRTFAIINNEIKQAQYMLLMLPREVIKAVPEIKALLVYSKE